MWGSVPETNSSHQQFQTPRLMAPAIIRADMNHADPNTMRARARQATEILKAQLFGTGAVEPLVALYFDDHIEQVEFQDPSVLEHFDVRTARSFDYLRTLVRIKNPQAAMITLDVRMGPFESDERDVLADTTAVFLMLDSPLLTIQVLLPYRRSGGRTAVSNVHYTEMPGEDGGAPCQLFKVFPDVPSAVC